MAILDDHRTALNNDGYCRSLNMIALKYSLHAFCCALVASLYYGNKKHVSNRKRCADIREAVIALRKL